MFFLLNPKQFQKYEYSFLLVTNDRQTFSLLKEEKALTWEPEHLGPRWVSTAYLCCNGEQICILKAFVSFKLISTPFGIRQTRFMFYSATYRIGLCKLEGGDTPYKAITSLTGSIIGHLSWASYRYYTSQSSESEYHYYYHKILLLCSQYLKGWAGSLLSLSTNQENRVYRIITHSFFHLSVQSLKH